MSEIVTLLVSTQELENARRRRRSAARERLAAGASGGTVSLDVGSAEFAAEFEAAGRAARAQASLEASYRAEQRRARARRFSVDLDSVQLEQEPAQAQVPDSDLAALRRRLLKGRSGDSPAPAEAPLDRQLEDHEQTQQTLIEDLAKLASGLKEGAVAFQTALDEDHKVLGAAERGIQVASRGLTGIRTKLGHYDRAKLGYLFYITTLLFMVIGLVLTFIIIKLFPAL